MRGTDLSTLAFRSLFLSDIHLGLRASRVEALLDLLRYAEFEQLYLVGDIIDFWKVRSGWHWPAINNELIRLIMGRARRGARVIYVPGNHDELFRDYLGSHFAGVDIVPRAVHKTADGRRFLVTHGDEFDCVVMNSRWLARLGSDAYNVLLWANGWFNTVRRKLGFGYWSLAGYLKHRVKEAVKYIGSYEEAVVHAAREADMDGVICGHIHRATITDFDGVLYANCGDWVESCTALAEDADGNLRLIHWLDESFQLLDEVQQSDADCGTDGCLVSPDQRGGAYPEHNHHNPARLGS